MKILFRRQFRVFPIAIAYGVMTTSVPKPGV